MKIDIDWQGPAEELRHTWAGYVDVDQFRWLLRRDMQDQLALAAQELGARHVRAVGLLDDELRVLAADPTAFLSPRYKTPKENWQIIDYVIDSLLDVGIAPVICTDFMPGALAARPAETCFTTLSHVSPPKDWNAWEEFVRHLVEHLAWRYGRDRLREWYFEVWNEPNLRTFWSGTRQEYFEQLWPITRRAIKSVDRDFRVGGPSTAVAHWVRELIEYGREHACEPDFIITHMYHNDQMKEPFSPFEYIPPDAENSPDYTRQTMLGVRKLLNELDFRGELHWNEWGRSSRPFDPWRESANEAAFIVKTMLEVGQSADYFAYWCLSDIYDQVAYGSQTFHGNYGLLNQQGLRKPSYHAHQLLCRLGHERLPARSGDFSSLSGAAATRSENGCQVLVYNFSQVVTQEEKRIPVSLNLPPGMENASVSLWRISNKENNIISFWEANGRPDYLRPETMLEYHKQNQLRPTPGACRVNRDHTVEFELAAPGVAFLEIVGEQ